MKEELNPNNRKKALTYLSDTVLEKMGNVAAGLIYKRVNVKAELGSDCYTNSDINPVEVTLGIDFFGKQESMTLEKIKRMYQAVYFHELGHCAFTDINGIKDYEDKDELKVLFPIINLHEDYVVERAMGFIFNIEYLFRELEQVMFGYLSASDCAEETYEGFLYALQAYHRQGTWLARKNKIFDENCDWIVENYERIADIVNPKNRFEEQCEFARKLNELLKSEGIDPVADYKNFKNAMREYLEKALEAIMKSSGDGERAEDISEEQSNDPSDREGLRESWQDLMDEVKASAEVAIEEKEDLCNEKRQWHKIVADQSKGQRVDATINRNSNYNTVGNYVEAKIKLGGTIRKLEESIKKCGRDYSEYLPGQLQGRFNLREAMRPGNFRNYDRILDKSIDPENLMFDILVDVSGSMTGSCARVAGLCAIALCEALEGVHVDYRFSVYSNDYSLLKNEKERLEKVKPILQSIMKSQNVEGLGFWRGNNETLAMKELISNSKTCKKQKILIHIGDGGFWFDNKNHISDTMTSNGYLTTLGVGLMCDEMSKYHKNSITVKNETEFDKLPKAILDYVASMFV